MGRGQQSRGAQRRKMDRESVNKAKKDGTYSLNDDEAAAAAANTEAESNASMLIAVVGVWFLICIMIYLSGNGSAPAGGASASAIPNMNNARPNAEPPVVAADADLGAGSSRQKETGGGTYTASQLMDRELDIESIVFCSGWGKKSCEVEVDTVTRDKIAVTTRPKATVHTIYPGLLHALPEANNDFTVTVQHSADGKIFYSSYANLDDKSLKKLKVGQEIDGKLGTVKDNNFELSMSMDGGFVTIL
ncbi:hypothetical protein TrST_g9813 [Triparma strigata]|uniref:Uncharacterized protein n=1 Tax=Triparma strigata TaxID=1606541 RepID=A0A9W7BVQ3_9STRA|nr:hypothetical protein TrST_g9813 [Triparma strigata]